MRFGSVLIDGRPSWGAVTDEEVALLDGVFPTLRAALENNGIGTAVAAVETAPRAPLDQVRWLPVIPDPGKIICIGLNYEDHRRETGRAKTQHPVVFTRFSDSQTAHGEAIEKPNVSDQLDYEGELAVIIGKAGRDISASTAMSHVAGFSCYNDGSVRDWQNHTIQFTPGKNFPKTGAFGPWMIPTADFGALGSQRLRTRLNGVVMQEARLEDMIFKVPELIEYISTFTALAPGDVIVSGTPGGVGAKREPPVFMQPGDTVEVEIDGIGVLANVITTVR